MAKRHLAMQTRVHRQVREIGLSLARAGAAAVLLMSCLAGAVASEAAAEQASTAPQSRSASDAASSATAAPQRRWLPAPRVNGRIMPSQIGLVINVADPYSVEVGEHYRQVHRLGDDQVLRVELPVASQLSVADFERLRASIGDFFGDRIQALALAWVRPFALECQSITAALTLGRDARLCTATCAKQSLSPYFNSRSSLPWRDHGLRPSMLLAASSVAQARRLIDRGHASVGRLALRGGVVPNVHYMVTTDAARNVRASLFPPAGPLRSLGIEVKVEEGVLPAPGSPDVLLVQTGIARFQGAESLEWLPGALADHLTSFGGVLDRSAGQSTVLDWIDAGATASYGTVSEPCNHPQKFPHPQMLLLHYLQGSSAIEAYWKSVAWPRQGMFVGDPLAAPYARMRP